MWSRYIILVQASALVSYDWLKSESFVGGIQNGYITFLSQNYETSTRKIAAKVLTIDTDTAVQVAVS